MSLFGSFKSAAKLLVKILKHPEVQGCFAGIYIQWSFNLEKAPWWGGIFERIIKSMKRCQRRIIGRGKLTMDEFVTATTEVEMIINCRPLPYLSTEDIEEPLTPSHLITGRRRMSLQDGPYNRDIDDTIEVNQNTLTNRWAISAVFWTTSGEDGRRTIYWSSEICIDIHPTSTLLIQLTLETL